MKRLALLLLVCSTFVLPLRAQCPAATYTTNMRPLPPNSTVSVVLDNSGAGFSGSTVSLTPDPSNLPPKFTLGGTSGNDVVSGIKNWNSQSTAAGTGITFAQQLPNASPVWIVSTAWPKATVTYKD